MSEQRLIDANALVKKIHEMPFYTWKDCENTLFEVLSAPTIEVESVRHGKWILDFLSPYRRNHYKCSACGKRSAKSSLYCPECGAKMDKE